MPIFKKIRRWLFSVNGVVGIGVIAASIALLLAVRGWFLGRPFDWVSMLSVTPAALFLLMLLFLLVGNRFTRRYEHRMDRS